MHVSDVLGVPRSYLGERISVEGSLHCVKLSRDKRYVWLSDPIVTRQDTCDPSHGLLVTYPAITRRLLSNRVGGSRFPFAIFECEGILVKAKIEPFAYSLIDVTSVKYKQEEPDEWCYMYSSMVPDLRAIQDVLSWPVSDDEKSIAILRLMSKLVEE